MKAEIERRIKDYVLSYPDYLKTETRWQEPIVAFANAKDELFFKLKEVVSENHAMPRDFMIDAQTVIAYFIPFEEDIVKSNIGGELSSREWAKAYIETNRLILDLNSYIKDFLGDRGFKSTIIPATHNFDEEKLISEWSHRHVAYIAGLGKFGLNNMLITKKGCCGRVGSIVTNLKVEATKRDESEYCLYKKYKTCGKCVKQCVSGALSFNGFNRFSCYELCKKNAEINWEIGYADVCGKCLVGMPCSMTNPVGE